MRSEFRMSEISMVKVLFVGSVLHIHLPREVVFRICFDVIDLRLRNQADPRETYPKG